MGKGLNTKSGRMAQMIRHGANPNVFDPSGLRVVTANFDHDYSESYEFDTRRRRGVNGAYFNAVTDGMGEGQLEGALCYNLMDDEILPYLLAKCVPADDVVTGGKRERVYYWPQYDRADREFFAFEEGRPGSALRGGFGMFTSFKLSSKTGKKSSLTVTIPFVTQAPVKIAEMTGASPQNGKFRLVANNVAGDVTLGIVAGALAKRNVTLPIGSSKAQIEAAFAAQGLTVTANGGIALSSGKSQSITYSGAGPITIGGVAVDLTTPETVNTLIGRIKAANPARSTLTGSGAIVKASSADKTVPGGGSPVFDTPAANGSTSSNAAAAFDNNEATNCQLGSGSSVKYTFDVPTLITRFRYKQPSNSGGYINGKVQGSLIGDFSDSVDLTPATLSLNTEIVLGNQAAYKAYRLKSGEGVAIQISEIEFIADVAASVKVTFLEDASAGNVEDLPVTGTGVMSAGTAPGAAVGQIDFEVTTPAQTRVVATKEAGSNNYLLSTQQQGGKGIAAAVAEPMPIEPGHLRFYHADTLAGLDAPEAYIGKISELELDVPKLCEPHHFHNNTESGPVTYSAHKEPDDLDVMLTVTLPTDENGDCAGLTDGTLTYVSKENYWRVKAVCPINGYEQIIEFFGSVGKSIPLTYNENVEERKFVFNLLENRALGWNFRWRSRVPA